MHASLENNYSKCDRYIEQFLLLIFECYACKSQAEGKNNYYRGEKALT